MGENKEKQEKASEASKVELSDEEAKGISGGTEDGGYEGLPVAPNHSGHGTGGGGE